MPTNPFDLFPLYLSLKVATLATVICFVLGVSLAWLLARRAFPGRDVVDALSTVPLVLPPSVLGYYLLVALGRNSPLGQALESALGLQLVFTWQGAVVAAGVVAFPLMVQSARAAFEGVDAGLEEVARTLGRSEWDIFRTVTLPLAWRGIFAGTVLAFARALGDFGTTLMVAGNIPGRTQTLSVAIYDAVQAGDDGRAVLLVAVVTTVAVALLLTARRIGQRVVR
jgi:molybdate transport system permease protein